MPKRIQLSLPVALILLLSSVIPAFARGTFSSPELMRRFSPLSLSLVANDREQDGLSGPVRRVKTETAKITVKNGKPVEAARVLLETTTFDNKGGKVDNAYFLAAGGSLTGKEAYKYDDKGNMVEMTLHNEDGTLASKEVYAYELDAFGNWTKMTTSVAIIEGGKLSFEPSEVSYRTISYFLDEATMAKMSQPNPAPAANAAAAAAAVASNAPAPNAAVNSAVKMNTAVPTSAPIKSATANAPAKKDLNKAAPVASVSLSSVDRAVVAKPSAVPFASNAASANSSGPVVKADGDAPELIRPRGPLKPISGGILNGKALSLPAPTYPEMAKRARSAGKVEIEVVIDLSGKVISAKASSGPALLRDAAEKAAMQAKFSPTLLTGQPVKVSGVITYSFALAQ